jgi:peptidoglycan-associated lipoprotein
VAFSLSLERAQVANVGCGCFWLQGGSTDVAVPFYRGLSIVGSFGGGSVSNIHPGGAGLSKLTYLGGPRYTFDTSHFAGVPNGPQIFGEALFGGAHGFSSTFPAVGAVPTSANSFAMQFGGGVDLPLAKGIGVRLIEADYVRTSFPNNGSNTQNDLRIAFGISYNFGTR